MVRIGMGNGRGRGVRQIRGDQEEVRRGRGGG